MSREDLTTYLNDHLAGSVSAVELLDHLTENSPSTVDADFFRRLKTEIREEQEVVRSLIHRYGAEESSIKQAGGWLLEKLGRFKLHAAGTEENRLGRLQALEGLVLGITGKLALWEALAVTPHPPAGLDLPALARRATEQRAGVEEKRLAAAREALDANE